LNSAEFDRIYKTYYKGGQLAFLEFLENIKSTCSRLSIILINHGTNIGTFGNKAAPLDIEKLCLHLTRITVPSILICSACYSPILLNKLALEGKKDLRHIPGTLHV